MSYVIYFIATAVAPSAFRSTQYQATHYFNQLAKHLMLTNYLPYNLNTYLAVILIWWYGETRNDCQI